MQKQILESLIEAKVMSNVADTRASGKIMANALNSANADVAGYVLVDVDTSTDVAQLRDMSITADYFALTSAYRANNNLAVWAYTPVVNTLDPSSYNDASEALVSKFIVTISDLQTEVAKLQGQLISATTKPDKAEGTRASTFRLKEDVRRDVQEAYGLDDKAFDKLLSNAKQIGRDAVFALWNDHGLDIPANVKEFYDHGQVQINSTTVNVPAESAEATVPAEVVESAEVVEVEATVPAEVVELPTRPSGYAKPAKPAK